MSAVFQKICALLLVVLLGLTGCTSTAAQTNQLAIGELSEPSTFNPVLNNVSTDFFNYTSEGLVSENVDGKGTVGPGLAESWKAEGNTITYTLRPNLKWSDGTPLTTDDVDFSFNDIYLNPNILSNAQDGLKIGKDQKFPTVKKIDDRHIAITTPEPFAPALLNIGGQAILPAHKLKALVKAKETVQEREDYKDAQGKKQFKMVPKERSKFMGAWGINTNPADLVSNGMYKLVSYTPGERLIFERNPYYWRKDAEGKQLPYIDRVVWQIAENTDNMLMQFRSKNVDTYRTSPDYFSLLKKEEKKGDFKIFNAGPSNGTSFLTFNQNKGSRKGKPLVNPAKSRWFNNVKFRQAVAYAIDRQRIINNLYRGLGALQNSPVSVGTAFYLNDVKVYNYDLSKAKQLLTAAGFQYKGNDLYDDQDNRVEFNLITNAENKFRVAMGAQIQQDLEKLGIKANFEPIAFQLLGTKMDKSLDWDALILSFTGGGIDPHGGVNVWLKDGRLHAFNQTPDTTDKDAEPVTDQEVAPWEKEISDLYIKGAQELDETKRIKIYYETQRLTQENLPFIYLVNSLSLHAIRNNLTGVKPSNLGQLWNLYEVKIQNAKMAAAK
jgi:peptide/nickel transport system substrate-binding protein